MILLDHPVISHEAFSLFSEWQFWIAMIGVLSTIVGSYFKQQMIVNTLKNRLTFMDEKFDARVDSLKEQMENDRASVKDNHNKLYDLCTEMNQQIGEMRGALKK